VCALALASVVSHTALAQTPSAVAEEYVREGQAIGLRYFTSAQVTDRDAWLAFITDGDAWVGDQLGDGALEFFRKAGLYGGGRLTLDAPVTAGQAVRIGGRLQMTELDDFDWPVRIDLIEVEGVWRLRAVRLTARRPFPHDAEPLALVDGYLAHIDTGLTRLEAVSEELPLHQALGQELSNGAGFWTDDTVTRGGAIGLYGHFSSVEPETVTTELLSADGDTASVRLRTEKTRRTSVQVSQWQLDLSRHATRGWEISGLARVDAEAQPDTSAAAGADTPPAPSGNLDNPVALVEHVLALVASSSDLMAFADAAAPYFADTREARRATAQLGGMRQLSGDVTPSWTVNDAGAGRVRAELSEGGQTLRMMMPALMFETTTQNGTRITNVAVSR
jgi:hypothetical protein